MEINTITEFQQGQLALINPSKSGEIQYYPCLVELRDGSILENVYIVELSDYLRVWGRMPDADRSKQTVLIEDVVKIQDSPNRLPVQFANQVYEAGESGMGYCLFKIVYENGVTLDIATGNAVDFVPSPEGLSTNNIVDVLPHQGSRKFFKRGLDYYWCLFKANPTNKSIQSDTDLLDGY